MNFIGEINNLTMQQVQDYLSGKTPFPGGQMSLAAHMPALAARAARIKMAEGGAVPKINKRMERLLMQRYANGGGVQRFKDGGYVLAYDAEGNPLGHRKDSEPPFVEEVRAVPSSYVPGSAASGIGSAVALPFTILQNAIGLTSTPWKTNVAKPATTPDSTKAGAAPAAPNPLDQMPKGKPPANLGASMSKVASAVGSTKAPATDGLDAALAKANAADRAALDFLQGKYGNVDAKALMNEKLALMAPDRSEARLKSLEGVKGELEKDRELGKWMALAQFASGMAGKRNLAAGLAGGIDRGIPALAQTQAEYRKGLRDLETRKMGIEDVADARVNAAAESSYARKLLLNDKAIEVEAKRLGLPTEELKRQLELAEFRRKQAEDASEASYRRALERAAATRAENVGVGKETPGPNGMTRKQAFDNAMKILKVDQAMVIGNPNLMQTVKQKAVEFYGAPFTADAMDTPFDYNAFSAKQVGK
jgi:hypothetical protein